MARSCASSVMRLKIAMHPSAHWAEESPQCALPDRRPDRLRNVRPDQREPTERFQRDGKSIAREFSPGIRSKALESLGGLSDEPLMQWHRNRSLLMDESPTSTPCEPRPH